MIADGKILIRFDGPVISDFYSLDSISSCHGQKGDLISEALAPPI